MSNETRIVTVPEHTEEVVFFVCDLCEYEHAVDVNGCRESHRCGVCRRHVCEQCSMPGKPFEFSHSRVCVVCNALAHGHEQMKHRTAALKRDEELLSAWKAASLAKDKAEG